MAHVTGDRVKEISITTGAGTLTLSGAVSKYRAFSSIASNGDTLYYAIVHRTAEEWEVGTGTWSSNTLARTSIYSSSNGGSAVSLSAGVKDVFCVTPAENSASLNPGDVHLVHLASDVLSVLSGKEVKADKGVAGGYASLDSSTILAQVIQFIRAGLASNRPVSGIPGQVYFSSDTGILNIYKA